MTSGIKTIIYPVKDLAAATELFAKIVGSGPTHEQPYYVQFNVDGQEIGLDPNGHGKGMTGPVAYWHVPDIEATVTSLLGAGAEEVQGITGVGGTRRIASVKDPDGNVIGLLQP